MQVKLSETAGQYLHRQKEATTTAGHPTAAVPGDSTPWYYTMQVGVVSEGLAPTVQDAEEADPGAEVFGICRDGLQGLGCGAKQQGVHRAVMRECQSGQLLWQRKDDIDIC